MRLTSPPARRVVWEDGMHLTPQHFQAQRRYHEEQMARTLEALTPFGYGLSLLLVDVDGLRNGTLALLQARGVLPDGTVFHLPEADLPPAPLAIAERFSPTRDAHVVHLVLAPWRADSANLSEEPVATATSRFRVQEDVLVDESTGGDPAAVRFAARNLRLLLDDDVTDAVVSLPIARIQRDGRGQFQLDATFVPPTLQIGGSERLLSLTRDVVGLLEAKGAALAATLTHAPSGVTGGAAAYAGNELATRWLLHAVRSADAPLRHLLLTRRVHAEQLYTELARLAGALCTFSFTSHPADVPLYQHDELTTTFDGLERLLRMHLDVVISSRAYVIPLARTTAVLHSAPVSDPRFYEPGVRWFLGVRAELSMPQLIDSVPRLTKSCASVFVMQLVERAFQGLATEHLPMPPSALAPKADLTYFELTMAGPCAASLQQQREFGVYVPDAIPNAYLELVVLLPQ